MKINLTNPTTNQFKQVKVGFSWTTFFFGCLPALFRGDWKWFFIMFILQAVTGGLTITAAGVGASVVMIIFAFIYNKLYINDLLKAGYMPSDVSSQKALLSKGFVVGNVAPQMQFQNQAQPQYQNFNQGQNQYQNQPQQPQFANQQQSQVQPQYQSQNQNSQN